MSTPLIPQAFWFRVAIPCRPVEGIPRAKGRLLDLPESCGLPDLAALEGRPAWAMARAAWNPGGLALTFEVVGKAGPISAEPGRPNGSDGVQVWIDTRDTRNVHRATRFCHRFTASIVPATGRSLAVEVTRKPIARAIADAPTGHDGAIEARAERTMDGWRLELFLPADALHGFDPESSRRLGLAYQVTDPDRGDQFLGVGREFPIGEDPSLWSTLELLGS